VTTYNAYSKKNCAALKKMGFKKLANIGITSQPPGGSGLGFTLSPSRQWVLTCQDVSVR